MNPPTTINDVLLVLAVFGGIGLLILMVGLPVMFDDAFTEIGHAVADYIKARTEKLRTKDHA